LTKSIRETKTLDPKSGGKASKGDRLQEVFGDGGRKVDMILRSIVPTVIAKDETITSKARLMKYLVGFLINKFGGVAIFEHRNFADVFLRFSSDPKKTGICDQEAFLEALKTNQKTNAANNTILYSIDRIVLTTATQVQDRYSFH
jgi:hypothetical protein